MTKNNEKVTFFYSFLRVSSAWSLNFHRGGIIAVITLAHYRIREPSDPLRSIVNTLSIV